jgi:hypothetical protein
LVTTLNNQRCCKTAAPTPVVNVFVHEPVSYTLGTQPHPDGTVKDIVASMTGAPSVKAAAPRQSHSRFDPLER